MSAVWTKDLGSWRRFGPTKPSSVGDVRCRPVRNSEHWTNVLSTKDRSGSTLSHQASGLVSLHHDECEDGFMNQFYDTCVANGNIVKLIGPSLFRKKRIGRH